MELACTSSDLQYLNSYVTWYLQLNWHGDVSALVDVNGNGDGWNNVSPFGGANAIRSVDLYYIHGGWWHPDMGIFLSLNEKGDYLFGGDDPPEQDPANDVWVVNAFVDFGKGSLAERAFVLTMGEFLQGSVTAAHQVFYPPANWTLADRFGNVARAYAPVIVVQAGVIGGAQAVVRGVPYLARTLLGRVIGSGFSMETKLFASSLTDAEAFGRILYPSKPSVSWKWQFRSPL